MQFTYHIEGMHCKACVEKIKSSLSPHFNIIDLTLYPPLLKIEASQMPHLNDLNHYLSLAGEYKAYPTNEHSIDTSNHSVSGFRAYYPLFLIVIYILGISFINNFDWHTIHWQGWMNQFMAGFFLVFSAFKLLDIRGFAKGYSTYDLLAKQWFAYGYIYPFLELSLGILYLTLWYPSATQLATIIIMGFSSLGVINSLLKKQFFQCACLGTLLKVPLSSVTLIEDLTMVVLAAIAFASTMMS